MIVPPHDPSVLMPDCAAATELLALVLVEEALAAVGIDTVPVKVPAAHIAIVVPAERYQFASGSSRQVPTVTGAAQPASSIESSMNLVRL